jgi:hypothetical protein
MNEQVLQLCPSIVYVLVTRVNEFSISMVQSRFEKVAVPHLVKFCAHSDTRSFVTVFPGAGHFPLS